MSLSLPPFLSLFVPLLCLSFSASICPSFCLFSPPPLSLSCARASCHLILSSLKLLISKMGPGIMVLKEGVSFPLALLYLSLGQGPILTSMAPPRSLLKVLGASSSIPVSRVQGRECVCVCVWRGVAVSVASRRQGWESSALCWTVTVGSAQSLKTGQG